MLSWFSYPHRLNNLFCDAVNVWLLLADEDALEVAIGSYFTAANRQRASMLDYARTAIEPIALVVNKEVFGASEVVEEHGGIGVITERLNALLDNFDKAQNQSLMAVRKAMTPENEKAVAKGDDQYFRVQYPKFILWE